MTKKSERIILYFCFKIHPLGEDIQTIGKRKHNKHGTVAICYCALWVSAAMQIGQPRHEFHCECMGKQEYQSSCSRAHWKTGLFATSAQWFASCRDKWGVRGTSVETWHAHVRKRAATTATTANTAVLCTRANVTLWITICDPPNMALIGQISLASSNRVRNANCRWCHPRKGRTKVSGCASFQHCGRGMSVGRCASTCYQMWNQLLKNNCKNWRLWSKPMPTRVWCTSLLLLPLRPFWKGSKLRSHWWCASLKAFHKRICPRFLSCTLSTIFPFRHFDGTFS